MFLDILLLEYRKLYAFGYKSGFEDRFYIYLHIVSDFQTKFYI